MVYPLAGLRPESANRSYFTGFETQKELDPDFLAFNSQNRRYHFPARFYLSFRGVFGQADAVQFAVLRSAKTRAAFDQILGFSERYSYPSENPLVLVDPRGLAAVIVGKPPVGCNTRFTVRATERVRSRSRCETIAPIFKATKQTVLLNQLKAEALALAVKTCATFKFGAKPRCPFPWKVKDQPVSEGCEPCKDIESEIYVSGQNTAADEIRTVFDVSIIDCAVSVDYSCGDPPKGHTGPIEKIIEVLETMKQDVIDLLPPQEPAPIGEGGIIVPIDPHPGGVGVGETVRGRLWGGRFVPVGCFPSDRDGKTGFESVVASEILERLQALKITTWNYSQESAQVRHLGPTAKDFRAAFGLGDSDKHINVVDAVGVSLAAIQALSAELEKRDQRIELLERELRRLEQGIARSRVSPS